MEESYWFMSVTPLNDEALLQYGRENGMGLLLIKMDNWFRTEPLNE